MFIFGTVRLFLTESIKNKGSKGGIRFLQLFGLISGIRISGKSVNKQLERRSKREESDQVMAADRLMRTFLTFLRLTGRRERLNFLVELVIDISTVEYVYVVTYMHKSYSEITNVITNKIYTVI